MDGQETDASILSKILKCRMVYMYVESIQLVDPRTARMGPSVLSSYKVADFDPMLSPSHFSQVESTASINYGKQDHFSNSHAQNTSRIRRPSQLNRKSSVASRSYYICPRRPSSRRKSTEDLQTLVRFATCSRRVRYFSVHSPSRSGRILEYRAHFVVHV